MVFYFAVLPRDMASAPRTVHKALSPHYKNKVRNVAKVNIVLNFRITRKPQKLSVGRKQNLLILNLKIQQILDYFKVKEFWKVIQKPKNSKV
jgi:hypothetical protein